jgi:crossover junction endodeoxyribonuclease RusA
MIKFIVFGRPQPQGSARAFIPKGWKRPVITSANKNLRSWRQEVAIAAALAMDGNGIIRRPEACRLEVTFYFDRPQSLKRGISRKSTKPDIEKLCRALADALTGICYEDDAQIDELSAVKSYGLPERTEVLVLPMTGSVIR